MPAGRETDWERFDRRSTYAGQSLAPVRRLSPVRLSGVPGRNFIVRPFVLNISSVKTRFIASLGANVLRAGINFLCMLLLARGLRPQGYGDMMFLLGTFMAARSLLDMGCANAFYTFISQRSSRGHYYVYGAWLALQCALIVPTVAWLLPQSVVDSVWLGHPRSIVLLAFVAVFLQQQVWPSVGQIGEASRSTVKVQVIGTIVALAQLLVVAFLLLTGTLSVVLALLVICVGFTVAAAVGLWLLLPRQMPTETCGFLRPLIIQYWRYCKPLVLVSWTAFLYDFLDRWMLQRFGGRGEQGFYQIAYQFAAASLIATASILNILWKEVAEANAMQDEARIESLYRKASRSLVLFGAALSGFLAPWSREIIQGLLGGAYQQAAPILALMFFYPVHQSLGQISSTLLLARGYTRLYMLLSVGVMAISLPVAYLLLAPTNAPLIAGLGLGAMGLALKMVLLNILSVNVQAWAISRYCRWTFDWTYQLVGIGSLVVLGVLAKKSVLAIWPPLDFGYSLHWVAPMCVAGILYCASVCLLLYAMPWLVSMSRDDLKALLRRWK